MSMTLFPNSKLFLYYILFIVLFIFYIIFFIFHFFFKINYFTIFPVSFYGFVIQFIFHFFPYFGAGLSGNDVHSLASSFFLAFPALYFIQHKYLLVPAAMASQHLLYHLYKALLYVHDIESVEIGVWWTMSVCFFFHPTRPKYMEIKMEKQKQKQKKKRVCFSRLNKKYVLRVYFLLTIKYVFRVVLVCRPIHCPHKMMLKLAKTTYFHGFLFPFCLLQ